MLCPYCNTEYSSEKPCFCHPTVQASPADEQPVAETSHSHNIAWNSHRGVRLD